MILTSGPSLLQKSDMCKRNQKLKEHSLSLKNSLVVNECDHSERTEAALNGFLVEFSTTSVLLFEGMLCSCKVLHSVPTNSSRCLVNQGAVLPFSASRSSKQAPVSILLQAIPCLIMQTLDFWKQQPQIFANLKENTSSLEPHQPYYVDDLVVNFTSIPGEAMEKISDGSSLSLYPHQVASHCPEGGRNLGLFVSRYIEDLWWCSISNYSPDIYRGSYFQ